MQCLYSRWPKPSHPNQISHSSPVLLLPELKYSVADRQRPRSLRHQGFRWIEPNTHPPPLQVPSFAFSSPKPEVQCSSAGRLLNHLQSVLPSF
ncbi:uncharacterized protein BDV14DRAFT_163693 [Aspergillus stella-maris]|uniref:uncharacterized protein n=1 Tax=Aspergillus stella-maris TaxID=1810926 RepID=UPI003CCE2555